MRPISRLHPLLLASVMCACTPGATTTLPTDTKPSLDASAAKTLTIAVRSEASSAAAKALQTTGSNVTPSTLFNAGLVYIDEREVPQAYLAESLPVLNTDTWRVFPDGRMETTYRLREGLTWHDGAPLTADDFVFALRVYHLPELGSSSPTPQNLISEIAAPDRRTVVIRWRQPYGEAGEMTASLLQALPRHILEEPFQTLPSDGFAAHLFWTTDYVGLGPYKIERWDPGVGLDASAFDGYVQGKPKVGKIRVVYIPDPNTVLANLLADTVELAIANSLPFNQALTLRREWAGRGNPGVVIASTSGSRTTEFQLHPDRVAPGLRGTLDVRVRQAMAHALNKASINEAVFEGEGLAAETRIEPAVAYFPEVDRTIRKYPFDLRRSEQLMNEAGYARGADGVFVSPEGIRFAGEDWIAANPQSELTQAIMLDSWKRAGFEIAPHYLSTVEQRSAQIRAERPGLYTGDGGTLFTLGSQHIPRPENRWTGSNRGSYSSPQYDDLLTRFQAELDSSQRSRLMVQMARVYSEDLPSVPIHYILSVTAHAGPLKGVASGARDIHLFEWRP